MLYVFHPRFFVVWLHCVLLGCSSALAQPAGQLYDPIPPADSAYLRCVLPTAQGSLEVSLDGSVYSVAAQKIGAYRIVRAGAHRVGVRVAGSGNPYRYTDIDLAPASAMTLVFPDALGRQPPLQFQDMANTNKLKARITLYHLADQVGDIDLRTGTKTVFPHVGFGKNASMQVNPVSVTFDAVAAPSPSGVLSSASVALQQGGTYSLFLLPGLSQPSIHQSSKPQLSVPRLILLILQNQTERYVPKP